MALGCAWGALALACGEEGTLQRPTSSDALPTVPNPASSIPGSANAAASGAGASSSPSPADDSERAGSPATLLPSQARPGTEDATPATLPAPGGRFELAWQDDFDTFDRARWQLMTHSWDTNLAQFSGENARTEAGVLSLLLTPEASDPLKPFRGVEMRSLETLTYGKVEARVRLARGSGVVSSLVLLYTPWPAADWNELDIEYLGRYGDRVQFNAMVYTGPPPTLPVQQSVVPTQFPELAPLAFDPSQDFHVFAIEWTPAGATFTVDGEARRTWSSEIARLKLPQNILLTIWASSSADWAGPILADSAPARVDYDWVRVYHYSADAPAVP
jgi:beta-glucanase (GH16 family)